jgi:G3E family GTPase
MQLRGPDLLRVKGFLNVKDCKGPVVVQFVRHLSHPPVELQSWPDDSRQSRIVFITRNISVEQVSNLLEALRKLA